MNAGDEFAKNVRLKNCNCLPDCISVTYDMELSQAPSDHLKYNSYNDSYSKSGWVKKNQSLQESTCTVQVVLKITYFHSDYSYYASTNLYVSFKDQHFIALNRSETTTFSNFVASCGGLMGLFMGISLLSIVEMVYFFTLRLFCTIKQETDHIHEMNWANKRRKLLTWQRKRF